MSSQISELDISDLLNSQITNLGNKVRWRVMISVESEVFKLGFQEIVEEELKNRLQ